MPAASSKLQNLYDCLLTDWPQMEAEILAQIRQPADTDTHSLSLLLEEIPRPVFLQPVLEVLAGSAKTDPWTRNYLYAATELLEKAPDGGNMAPEGLQERLIDWVLNYKSETSWYASGVLCYFTEKEAEDAMLQKIMADDDFFITLANCLTGLMWIDKKKYWPLVQQIAEDPTRDAELRKWCKGNLMKEAARNL